MYIQTQNSGEVKIGWIHQNEGPKRKNNKTICEVTLLGSGTIYTGISRCSKSDNYNKAIGRKKSLAIAIKDIPKEIVPKEDRRTIWLKVKEVSPKTLVEVV